MIEALLSLPPLQLFLVGVGVSVVGAKIVEMVFVRVIHRLAGRTSTTLDDVVVESLYRPVYITVALAGILLSVRALDIPQQWHAFARMTVISGVLVYWLIALVRAGGRFFEAVEGSDRFDHELIPVFENLWTFFVIIGGLFAFLSVWNVDITPLLASAGIAGVAIGFAAKDTVANFFGGIALYFDDTYKIGDYVVLDSGDAGTVIDVGVRSTTLKTRNDVMLTVPNSVLNSSKIINESAPDEPKRIDVRIGVAYGTDIDQLEEILLEIAEADDSVRADPSPKVRFREFGDSALNYSLLCWVDEPLQDVRVRHELNRTIYNRLDEEDIEIPFPQRTIHYGEDARSDPSMEDV